MITPDMIKELRARTGAGVVDCRNALQQAGGDLERAVELLRARGLVRAEQRAGRAATEGLVEAYIHTGGRIGAMVEVNCETDFVARTEEFRRLCRDLAMQVAATAPRYVSREDVPPEAIAAQRAHLGLAPVDNPAPAGATAADGALAAWYREVVLLEQAYIRDERKTVRDLITEAVARIGEHIQVRRFARFQLGE